MAANYRQFNTISIPTGQIQRKFNLFPTSSGQLVRKFQLLGSVTSTQTINSNARVLNSTQQTINSSTYLITLIAQNSILSNANIILAEQHAINSGAQIEVDGIQFTINSNAFINYGHNEQALLSDATVLHRNSSTVNSDSLIAASYQSKFIHDTNLYIATRTTPTNLIKVDISTSTPTWTIYPMISGLDNADNLVLNFLTHYLYSSCDNGQVLKASMTNPAIVTPIYVGESPVFVPITHLSDYRYTYVGADTTDGELYMIEETNEIQINTDLRFLQIVSKTFNNFLSFLKGLFINTDLRFLTIINNFINTDLRFLKTGYNSVQPLSRSQFVVKINGTQNDFVCLDSINVNLTVDTQALATFRLARYHDKLDYDLNNAYVPITTQNAVEIWLSGRLIFTGKVSVIQANSETEDVTVTSEGSYPALPPESPAMYSSSIVMDKALKQLPLTTKNAKLGLYDILINDITLENPEIDPDDVNPLYFNGIKAQLGNWEIESVYREDAKYWGGDAEEFEDFVPEPNYEYFWYASGVDFITGWSFSNKYIGTSLAPLSNDTFDIQYFSFKKQRRYKNIIKSSYITTSHTLHTLGTGLKTFWVAYGLAYKEGMPVMISSTLNQEDYMEGNVTDYHNYELTVNVTNSSGAGARNSWDILPEQRIASYYYVGSEPFKEISVPNGWYVSFPYWEDREDGLYEVITPSYDFRPYVRAVCDNEYRKMGNINGHILPKTSTSISLTLDAYLYYNLRLLNRVNVTNTLQSNIYKNNHGFPISIKSIAIDSKSMMVTLSCDNQWSRTELDAMDAALPSEPYINAPTPFKVEDKFDLNAKEDIT
jgi:hypothetical protein